MQQHAASLIARAEASTGRAARVGNAGDAGDAGGAAYRPRYLLDAADRGTEEGPGGAVTLIQRFGSAANLNSHLHYRMPSGVYRCGADGPPDGQLDRRSCRYGCDVGEISPAPDNVLKRDLSAGAPRSSWRPPMPASAGATRAGSNCCRVPEVRSSIEETWASPSNHSRYWAAPPRRNFSVSTDGGRCARQACSCSAPPSLKAASQTPPPPPGTSGSTAA